MVRRGGWRISDTCSVSAGRVREPPLSPFAFLLGVGPLPQYNQRPPTTAAATRAASFCAYALSFRLLSESGFRRGRKLPVAAVVRGGVLAVLGADVGSVDVGVLRNSSRDWLRVGRESYAQ